MREAGRTRANRDDEEAHRRRRRATRSGEHALRTLVRKADVERPPLDAEYLAMHRIAPFYGEDEPELETDGDSLHGALRAGHRGTLRRISLALRMSTVKRQPWHAAW
jgi:hypothetical protein